jgi:hypothetical protein
MDTFREWRKQQALPPRTSDLVKAALKLEIYGDEEDSEEQQFLKERHGALYQMADQNQMTVDEVLMLTGAASSKEEAQMVLHGHAGGAVAANAPLLYNVENPDGDEEISRATTDLADSAAQLQLAVAVHGDEIAERAARRKERRLKRRQEKGSSGGGGGDEDKEEGGDELDLSEGAVDEEDEEDEDEWLDSQEEHPVSAVAKVINETKNFFLHGMRPWAALDELDKVLLRKMTLLEACHGSNRSEGGADGPGQFVYAHDFRLTTANISTELLCGVRVHLMNETELDVFCKATKVAPPLPTLSHLHHHHHHHHHHHLSFSHSTATPGSVAPGQGVELRGPRRVQLDSPRVGGQREALPRCSAPVRPRAPQWLPEYGRGRRVAAHALICWHPPAHKGSGAASAEGEDTATHDLGAAR